MLRYGKTTLPDGVDSWVDEHSPGVVVPPSALPAPLYPEDPRFWHQFDAAVICAAVMRARGPAQNDHVISPAFQRLGARTMDAGVGLIDGEPAALVATEVWRRVKSPWRVIPGLEGQFSNRHVLVEELVAWAARAVAPSCFAAKWHFMMPRPEETAAAVLRGELVAPWVSERQLRCVFPDPSVVLDNPSRFTQYEEGCPDHPAYPAMHSACAGAQLAVVDAMFELSGLDRHNAQWAFYNKAYFRTWAGVHYPMDNLVGLWLGHEVVRLLLPGKLAEYGADPGAVAALVPALPAPVF